MITLVRVYNIQESKSRNEKHCARKYEYVDQKKIDALGDKTHILLVYSMFPPESKTESTISRIPAAAHKFGTKTRRYT